MMLVEQPLEGRGTGREDLQGGLRGRRGRRQVEFYRSTP